MADDAVKAFDKSGGQITVPPEQVAQLVASGGRIATPEEIASHTLEQHYNQASTLEKVGQAALGGGVGPTHQAFLEAGKSAFTGGVNQALVRQGADLIAPGAGEAYEKRIGDLETAHPTASALGTAAGIAGQVAVSTQVPVPGAAFAGRLGLGAARGLGAGAETVLGRAALSGGELAARGAYETALYSGTQEAAGQVFRDEPINGEKIAIAVGTGLAFGGVLGGGLGAAGSLAKSGAQAASSSLLSRLEAATTKAEEASSSLESKASAEPVALKSGGQPAPAASSSSSVAAPTPSGGGLGTAVESKVRSTANDLAFSSLNPMPNVAKKLEARVAGGTEAIGDWMNRNIYNDPDFMTQAKISRVDGSLPLIEAKNAANMRAIGDAIKPYANVRMNLVEHALEPAFNIENRMLGSVTERPGVSAFKTAINNFEAALSHPNASGISKVAPDGSVSLSDLYYARAELEGVAHEAGNKGSAANSAVKEFSRELDGLLVNKLGEAAEQVGDTAAKERLLQLKREVHLGLGAQTAAESGAGRVLGNQTFSLGDKIAKGSGTTVGGVLGGAMGSVLGPGGAAVGASVGGFIGGQAAGIGAKLARERGEAMGAWALSRAADRGTIAKMVGQVQQQLNASAKGVLREGAAETAARSGSGGARGQSRPASEGSSREAQRMVQKQGEDLVRQIGRMQADPSEVLKKLEDASSIIAMHGGQQTAQRYTVTALRALNYVASYIPVKERRDPLDPRSTPPLSYEEADRLIRAAHYANDPKSVYADFQRGKVTPEGLRAAKEFTADTFEEFQSTLHDHVIDHMTSGGQLSQNQRLRIDKILGSPAGPDLRPAMIKALQANLAQDSQAQSPPAPPGGPPPPGHPPVNLKVQQTGFDAVEARKSAG